MKVALILVSLVSLVSLNSSSRINGMSPTFEDGRFLEEMGGKVAKETKLDEME